MQNISSLLVIFFMTFPVMAQEQDNTWSLEDCINYAMENNIQIKQSQLNTRYNENNLEQSRIEQLPNLNASTNYSYSWGRALDQTTYTFTENEQINSISVSASSSATLFNGFQQRNTIERNRLDLMASYEDVEKIKNDISLNIAAAYLQILFNQELLQVARNQMEITGQQVERTEKMVRAGKLARGSALEIQAQFAAEELNVVNAENQLRLSDLNLQQYLDLEYNPEFTIVSPDLPLPQDTTMMLNANEIFTVAEEIMPGIKGASLRLQSAQTDLKIAKGMRSPRLNLSGNYNTGYSDIRQKVVGTDEFGVPQYGEYPFWEQMRDNISVGVGLGLSIPIFNGWQVNTAISNSRIAVENARLELEAAKNNLYKSIQQAYSDALTALRNYRASEKALISMEESFKYTEKKYEVGLVNTVEYNASKNQLTQTKSDLLQAKYEFLFKIKILHFYEGQSITL